MKGMSKKSNQPKKVIKATDEEIAILQALREGKPLESVVKSGGNAEMVKQYPITPNEATKTPETPVELARNTDFEQGKSILLNKGNYEPVNKPKMVLGKFKLGQKWSADELKRRQEWVKNHKPAKFEAMQPIIIMKPKYKEFTKRTPAQMEVIRQITGKAQINF